MIKWLRLDELNHSNCADLKNAYQNNEPITAKPKDCQEIDPENGRRLCLRFSNNSEQESYYTSSSLQVNQGNEWSSNQNQSAYLQTKNDNYFGQTSQNMQNAQHFPAVKVSQSLPETSILTSSPQDDIKTIDDSQLVDDEPNNVSEHLRQYNATIDLSEDDFYSIVEELKLFRETNNQLPDEDQIKINSDSNVNQNSILELDGLESIDEEYLFKRDGQVCEEEQEQEDQQNIMNQNQNFGENKQDFAAHNLSDKSEDQTKRIYTDKTRQDNLSDEDEPDYASEERERFNQSPRSQQGTKNTHHTEETQHTQDTIHNKATSEKEKYLLDTKKNLQIPQKKEQPKIPLLRQGMPTSFMMNPFNPMMRGMNINLNPLMQMDQMSMLGYGGLGINPAPMMPPFAKTPQFGMQEGRINLLGYPMQQRSGMYMGMNPYNMNTFGNRINEHVNDGEDKLSSEGDDNDNYPDEDTNLQNNINIKTTLDTAPDSGHRQSRKDRPQKNYNSNSNRRQHGVSVQSSNRQTSPFTGAKSNNPGAHPIQIARSSRNKDGQYNSDEQDSNRDHQKNANAIPSSYKDNQIKPSSKGGNSSNLKGRHHVSNTEDSQEQNKSERHRDRSRNRIKSRDNNTTASYSRRDRDRSSSQSNHGRSKRRISDSPSRKNKDRK